MDMKVNHKGRLVILVVVLAVSGDVWCFTTVPEGLGAIRLDLWWNIGCRGIPCLLNDSRYPDNPDETRLLTSFNSGLSLGEYYGGQIHGWLHPSKSGDYTFWLCTDDEGELFLSTDESPANIQLIASESSWTNPYTWKSGGEEQSAPIGLVGGRKYYIMARWTESAGGDQCQVAWQGPDQPLPPVDDSSAAIIPGNRLSPFEQSSAYDPDPYDGQASIPTTYTLRWDPGEYAAEHDVYLSTSKALVDSRDAGVFQGRVVPNNFGPIGLDTGAMYYWAIDEVNDSGPDPGIWYGPTWFFRTEGAAGGLLGLYYHWSGSLTPGSGGDPGPRRPFNDFVMSRVDREVNFNWVSDSPDPSVNVDQFACKWTGHVEAPVDANYTFYTTTDEGALLFIDGVQILPDASWQIQPMKEWSGSVILTAGLHDIEMHQFEYMGGAGAELRWSSIPVSPSDNAITKQIIPPIWLWPHLYATVQQPTDESIIDDRTPALEWEPGLYATYHELYFSSNYDDVNDRNPADRQVLIDPCRPYPAGPPLQFNKTYYWCVDEVRSVTERWDARTIWSFTTAPRIFVDIRAGGANDGTSWENAYNFLQDALSEARAAPTPVEIHVAQGIYTPDSNSSAPTGTGDRRSSFGIVNKTSLKGGYAGAGAPDPNARNIELYETIFSGDLNGDDGPDFANNGENSYHVVTGSGNYSMETTIIDGFTITGGYANGPESFDKEGAGIKFYVDCGFRITNCTIIGNKAESFGGGMYSVGNGGHGSTIINCRFISNTSNGRGGGLCLSAESIPHIINCIISRNEAVDGGAIYVSEGYPRIINSTISRNIALGQCGGAAVFEGCLIFSNCILWANLDSGYNDEAAQIQGQYVWINYSCVQGWTGDLGGIGNIDADPCFADPCNGDYHLKSEAGRWDANRQIPVWDDVTSPCIDAGNPGCPIGEERAPNGNRRNMGAYGGTAEASKSPANWRSIADITNDWTVDSDDLRVYVDYWLESGECIPGDFDRSQFVDFNDFAIFGSKWQEKGPGPGITYEVDNCIPWEPGSSMAVEPNQTRFSVRVEGNNIHFEDLITANCCADRIELQMTVEGNLITIYEIEQLVGVPCPCICDYPVTATLGPFEEGTYLVEVIGINGSSLGVVEVTIGGSPEPGITFQIDECDMFSQAEQSIQARFSVAVDGLYIHFEDMMTANCCPDELGLEMTIDDDLITIYETEYTPEGCRCMCLYPVTATLGPFEPGIYTLEVYEDHSGFVGSTTVVIDPPQ